MINFIYKLLFIFFTAFGIILGGSLIGSLSTIFTGQPPLTTMRRLADDIKIWAVVAAIGGSFSSIEALGSGIFGGDFKILLKQLLFLVSSFAGAELGALLIYALTGDKQ